jgi:hypothetical protein
MPAIKLRDGSDGYDYPSGRMRPYKPAATPLVGYRLPPAFDPYGRGREVVIIREIIRETKDYGAYIVAPVEPDGSLGAILGLYVSLTNERYSRDPISLAEIRQEAAGIRQLVEHYQKTGVRLF